MKVCVVMISSGETEETSRRSRILILKGTSTFCLVEGRAMQIGGRKVEDAGSESEESPSREWNFASPGSNHFGSFDKIICPSSFILESFVVPRGFEGVRYLEFMLGACVARMLVSGLENTTIATT